MSRRVHDSSPRYVSEWAYLVPSVRRAEDLVQAVADTGTDLDHFVEALMWCHRGDFEIMEWELHLAGLGQEVWKERTST